MNKNEKEDVIEVKNLSVRVEGKTLFKNTNFSIGDGEIVLIVGPSGSGKTVLLKIITGLIDDHAFKIAGNLSINGKDIFKGNKKECRKTGIVFQDFALFDELSIRNNLNFALKHSIRNKNADKDYSSKLLKKLNIDEKVKIRDLSVGQKQRVAIARTLAYEPDIILYDEPTSGLDPQNSKNVAELIKYTNDTFKKTSLIVTHDYKYLLPIADNVLFLDAQNTNLTSIEKGKLEEKMRTQPALTPTMEEKEKMSKFFKIKENVSNFFIQTSKVFTKGISLLYFLIPIWKSPIWGLRFFIHYLKLISFASAILYILTAGIIIGFVSTYFIFEKFPYRAYTEPLLIEDILSALGFFLYRVLVPVVISILIAARCGAAVAADVGNRVYSQQTDSMKSLNAPPNRYLLTNIIFAFLVGFPLLTYIAFFAAKYTSLTVFTFHLKDYSPHFWDTHFHSILRVPGEIFYEGTGWVFIKTLICGLGVGGISFYHGITEKKSVQDVNSSITKTVICATLFVLIVHFTFSFFEFGDS